MAFTHHVETLLDRLREGEIALTPDLSTLLLQSNDQIRLLVAPASGNGSDDAQGEATRAALVARLGAQAPARPTPATPVAAAPAPDGASAGESRCDSAQTPSRNGMDPLAILSYAGAAGQHGRDPSATPPRCLRWTLDPEQCHLGFAFELHADKPRHAIEAAFSFVRDDCDAADRRRRAAARGRSAAGRRRDLAARRGRARQAAEEPRCGPGTRPTGTASSACRPTGWTR
ncbi:hypothetical protein [Piscinibacter sp.]|uniref:hypothetical protein n=1 Tax=Piscinibacter sp. TaxID=1903157 RepID=UPI0025FCEF01|nr:hypothetical protein [Piscinibacter sp.]